MAETDTHVFNQENDYEPVPYSVGVVSEEAGEKLWVPDIPVGQKPAYGMMYHSLQQAYEYYKDYAKRAGFEVRLGQQYKSNKNKHDNLNIKYFVCSKEGTNPAPTKVGAKSKQRKHSSKRTDCKAAFRVKYFEGRGYWCYEFIEGHNHSLVNEEDSVFLVSSRDVSYTQQVFLYQASQVNLGPVKGFNLLRVIYGEYDFIGVGPDLAKDETFKQRISDIVWTDRIEPEEFEDLWERLLVDFDLKSHEWLLDMYNLRHKWIPAYYRNELMSGLMRTSSRSESENNAYGRLTSIDLTLWEFYNHFDSVVGCQKFAQRKNDHDSRYTIPDFHTELQIEKEASELYTRSIFFDVQTEIYASVISCMSVSVSDVDSGKKYVIQDTGEDEKLSRRHRIVKGKPLYDVFYEVKTFPRKYMLRRWSQDSLPPASVIQASGDTPDMILREIFRSVEYCVNRYANEPELLQKFRDHQVQLIAKADADVPIPKKTNKRDRIASILGVSQPEEIVVNIPKQVSTKGSRKRIKSSIERSMNPSGKRRKNCRFCKCSMNDHNQAKCNAVRAQIAAKKASDKAALREMKQRERLAAEKARLAEKNASVLAAKKARLDEKNASVLAAKKARMAENNACVVS
ncbi:FAR1 DNA binding domain, Zinc finger, SWIM-type, MULE transposase domain, FHY3/FAR1 family [Artemisia annua]|uniref:FAR1 DNA binding domain, Zinc finger, SWIM-type, MULE transposase domain, FHY3/FAR1 family n=1 Tax=Artemisia annua TaxID=35608 RepID=A0A2U1MPR9_ARTAN|nr:FAR1 DNA binding domain, Zinc finger, SWIM-type, MULE transposase domain, FHY3/FAR1 family [Artemisia annua]